MKSDVVVEGGGKEESGVASRDKETNACQRGGDSSDSLKPKEAEGKTAEVGVDSAAITTAAPKPQLNNDELQHQVSNRTSETTKSDSRSFTGCR